MIHWHGGGVDGEVEKGRLVCWRGERQECGWKGTSEESAIFWREETRACWAKGNRDEKDKSPC